MSAIRCAVVDPAGLVMGCFMASPDNAAINSGKPDAAGRICIAHDLAQPGDTIINGVWAQSVANAQAQPLA